MFQIYNEALHEYPTYIALPSPSRCLKVKEAYKNLLQIESPLHFFRNDCRQALAKDDIIHHGDIIRAHFFKVKFDRQC